jgi:alanine racemase
MRSTVALVYHNNIIYNLNKIRSFIKNPKTGMCVAVKADGYGCGAVFAAEAALSCGATHLAVATVDEGRELRNAGITCPVLLLSLCTPEEMVSAVQAGLTPLVFDETYIDAFDKAAGSAAKTNKRCAVHLAVDTGMGRIGCFPDEAARMAHRIVSSEHLSLGGICTHFAAADSISPENRAYTAEQFRQFCSAVDTVKAAGIDPGIKHCAASAALLDHPEMQLDMVRPGIIVYGYYAGEINESYLAAKGTPCPLKPVMALRTEVAALRPFSPGKSVSYGRIWTAPAETDIAVLSAGYADGLLRRYSPGLMVTINGREYPVRGRICMDQCMVDIGKNNQNVHRWDKVYIFGPKECGALKTAGDIAEETGTISYEIMTAVSKRVPRIVV